MSLPALDAVFVRDSRAVTRRIAGDIVLVPVRDNVADLDSIYTLNETGSFIWDQVDGKRNVGALIEAVTATFEISFEEAAGDVTRLIEDLRGEGLIRPVAP